MYAKVINNEVTQLLPTLPKTHTFENGDKTGNFDLLETATHIQEGFYPVEDDKPASSNTQTVVFDGYEIFPEKVVRRYRVEDISLEELKSNKLAFLREIEELKTSNNTFLFNNEEFNLTEKTVSNALQMQALIGIGIPFPANFTWTTAADTEYAMTEETFMQFATTMAATKLFLIGVGKFHAESIKSLTDAAEVLAYDIMAGW